MPTAHHLRKWGVRTVLALSVAALAGCADKRATPAQKPAALAGDVKSFGVIERKDPRFDKLVPQNAAIEKLADGFKWSEGPVWVSDGQYLLFSDVPNNVVHKWKQGEGISEFLKPSGYTGSTPRGGEPGSNGLTLDHDGRLTLCEHGDRRVARLTKDGKKETIVDKYEGKRFNSPNDLCWDSKGNLFFTDPPYGLVKNVDDPAKEIPFQGVYRVSKDGKLTLLTKDLTRPNGVALSPDEKTLYVAVSDPKQAIFMAYDLKEDGTITNGRVFFDATEWAKQGQKGLPDGIKCDRDGNLWATGPGGVYVFAPDGTVLGVIRPADPPTANVGWGDDGSTLYITSNHTLCRLKTTAKGILPGKH